MKRGIVFLSCLAAVLIAAKTRGVYKGRKRSVDVDKIRELKEAGMGAVAIARELGIGRACAYRALSGVKL